MKNIKDFDFLRRISAVLPEYDENGNNLCRVIYWDGEDDLVRVGMETFLSRCAFAHGTHLGYLRQVAREYLNVDNRLPLVMSEHFVLVPVKTRRLIGPKDGCHGFIDQASVADFDEDEICLHNGLRIPYLSVRRTLTQKMQHASLLAFVCKDKAKSHHQVYCPSKHRHEAWDQDLANQLSLFYDMLTDRSYCSP